MTSCATFSSFSLVFLRLVSAFQILLPEDTVNLDLSPENPELIRYAALSGSVVTAPIREPRQLVIAQNIVTLTLDCSSLLLSVDVDPLPDITWERKRNSSCVEDSGFMEWQSSDDRLRVAGQNNTEFQFKPTNSICGGESSDGGEYRCTVCVPQVSGEDICTSRTTTVLLIGSAPELKESTGCEITNLNRDYSCSVGEPNITLPTTVDPTTGVRSFNLSRFVLECETATQVTPRPRFSWLKNGVPVVTDIQEGTTVSLLEDDFYMLGDNSFLLYFMPRSPITVDFSLRLIVDFSLDPSIGNVTEILAMFDEGTTVEDVRRMIRNSVVGNWTCMAANALGNSSRSSIVSVSTDCSGGCSECEGVATCSSNPIGCECTCPSGFIRDRPGCADVNECLSNETNSCNSATESCVNTDGSYQCVCKAGFVLSGGQCVCEPGSVFFAGNQSCIDCGFSERIADGAVSLSHDSDFDGNLEVEVVCLEGLQPENDYVSCNLETSSSGVTAVVVVAPICVEERIKGCGLSCYVPIIIGLLLALVALFLVLILVWYRSRRQAYYPQKKQSSFT